MHSKRRKGFKTTLIFWLVNAWAHLRHPRLCDKFRRECGRLPNVANPGTVQEKFLWRKLFDHDPRFSMVQDKLLAKEYAQHVCPDLAVPKTLWSGDDLQQAPKELLNGPGVLKPNQNCGKIVFLPDDSRPVQTLRQVSRKWLRKVHGKRYGEWAYKGIVPKLFIEERMQNDSGDGLYEIKTYACSGKVTHTVCFIERFSESAASMVVMPDGTPNATKLANVTPHGLFSVDPVFHEAVRIGGILCAEFDFMRADFLVANGKLYFGEFTVYPVSGFPTIQDKALIRNWAESWDLGKSWFLSHRQPGWRGVYAQALQQALEEQSGQAGA